MLFHHDDSVAAVAADVAVGKMHAAVARKAVEAVAMEAAMAALRAMRNDAGMVSLEAVAMEAAKVAVRELCDGVIARQAKAEVLMYVDDAADEESHVTATAVVAAGTTAWLLVDDKTEVEADDEDKDAEAAMEADCDAELRAVSEAECVTTAEATKHEAAERAAHWAPRDGQG
jgi:hypothetical protein